MHRLAGGGALQVAAQHRGTRVPRLPLQADGGEHGALPGRAGLAGGGPRGDHGEQPVCLGRVDAGLGQSLPGGGQRLGHEVRGDYRACLVRSPGRPGELGGQAVLRGPVEVVVGPLERHRVGPALVLAGQPQRQADLVGGVGHHVHDRGAGRERPHLDPQVPARRWIVDRPVPAPHRALVQPQLVEPRRPPARTCRAFVRRGDDRQHRLMQADAFGEQFRRAAAQPAGAERGPCQLPARRDPAVLDRLLEQGHPRLLPEPVAEEARRVAGHGQRGGGGQLDRVVGAPEGGGLDSQVHLERRVRPFRRDLIADQGERIGAGDMDAERVLAQPAQAVAQGAIARRVRDHGAPEIARAEGGQDADHRDPAAVRAGRPRDRAEQQAKLLLERGERAAGQQHRRGVELQVEPVQLDVDPRVGGGSADGKVHGQRTAVEIDQDELKLGADAGGTQSEIRAGDQLPKLGQAFLEAHPKAPVLVVLKGIFLDVPSHGRPSLLRAVAAVRRRSLLLARRVLREDPPPGDRGRQDPHVAGPVARRPRCQRQLA